MGCKLGRMGRVAETSEVRQADEALRRIERVVESGEGLQAARAHRRMERVSETGEGWQAEETQEQGRTERIAEPGEGRQVEQAQQHGRMERLAEPGERLQGDEEQERVSWRQLQRADEIEERTELVAIQREIRRLRQILFAEVIGLSNRRMWELSDGVEAIRLQISVLEQEQRGWRTILDRSRMIAQGEVLHVLQDETVNDSSRRGAPPASRTAVDGLPSISIQQQQVDDGDASCAVCLDVLPCGESAKQLPCLHVYHDSCILRWLQSRNSCPVCRHELPTDNVHYEDKRRNRL